MLLKVLFVLSVVAVIKVHSAPKRKSYSKLKGCNLGPLAEEIASYDTVVRDIIDYVKGPFKGKTYEELAKFVDTFGARVSGSEVLERSIDYMDNLTRNEGVNDVVHEDVEVPYWIRGEEKLIMLNPRVKNMNVLGLGHSVPTPPEGITAEVVVVSSFEELSNYSNSDIAGKIVLFDPKFTTYSETVKYRTGAAVKSAEKGAVAALVRSIAPFSINSPHTGMMDYAENVTQIPTAAITLEDADLIRRLHDSGDKVKLRIRMSSTFVGNKTSRNTLVDVKGSKHPEKLVIVSGHIDSWDVGQGAMDDGGGLFISWAVPVILKRLSLTPKRTIRSIYWTGEEQGLLGAEAYKKQHQNDLHNIDFILESDEGAFAPLGLEVAGTQEARCIIAEVLKHFESMNASTLVETKNAGSDISVIVDEGVPGASLHNANDRYFWFHHTEGDTMNVYHPDELDMGAAFWTAVAYIIADISADVPHGPAPF